MFIYKQSSTFTLLSYIPFLVVILLEVTFCETKKNISPPTFAGKPILLIKTSVTNCLLANGSIYIASITPA